MEETLEPIRPTEDTPYGALIIGYDVLCTPTSLCTWSEEGKPEIYCSQPAHTLNPVCQTVNKGIGLVDCYSEPTCGGMVRPETTEKILRKNPHYRSIIREEETRRRGTHRFDYAWAVIGTMSVVLLAILLGYGYKARKRRRRRRLNQSRKR